MTGCVFNPFATWGIFEKIMSVLSDDLYLDNIEEYVQDENRIVDFNYKIYNQSDINVGNIQMD